MKLVKMWLNINGTDRMVVCDPEKDTLAILIRRIGLTGTKVGCGTGVCGSCSVILNGQVVRSCTRKMKNVKDYSTILTIEGIGTPQNLHPIQQAFMTCGAVQCGFCSPGFIVSTYALLEKNTSPTREEVRSWFKKHRNICRCTGYKTIVDAVMLAAQVMRGEKNMADITYKEPENGEYYGTAIPRPTSLPKVTGLCDYGDDIALKMPSGTLHLAVVQPRIAHHANILKIDMSEAEKAPGVVQIITAKDIIGTNHLRNPSVHPRNELKSDNFEILCAKKIFRYGDVVALVAADTHEHAREAAKLVKVDIEQLPEYLNYLDAVAPDAIPIQNGPNQFIKQPVFKGDFRNVESIIHDSAHSVSGSFYSSREPHMTIEGDVIQAYWGIDDMLTIQGKSQGINLARIILSPAIGLPMEKIRVINNQAGGSFGWALSPASLGLAAVAAIATGMPVSLSMSYEEFMHHSGKRAPSYTNTALGCDENGKITGLQYDIGMEVGPYPIFAERLVMKVAVFFGWPYYYPTVTGIVRTGFSNHAYCTAFRGFGSPQVYTASEQIIDMLAVKAGIDPFEFRCINVGRVGDTSPTGLPFREIPAIQLLNEMRPLYHDAVKKAKDEDTQERRRGVGISFGCYSCSYGNSDSASCRLELNPDDSISVYNTWSDVGQGGDAGAVMVVLEALKPLKLKPSQVNLRTNDSKLCPDSGSAASSRSHMMNGFAAIETAKLMLKARDKGNGEYRTFNEMKEAGFDTVFEATFTNSGVEGLCDLDPDTGHGNPLPTFMYALFMAEVEVDTRTGKATVLKITAICDVGRIGNIEVVLGQGYSGISHSIGFALSENYDNVKKHNNIAGAGVPAIDMIPDEIDIRFIENPRENTPFGSSGCAEMFQAGAHTTIINAIFNGCGVRIFELPATPEKIKAGLDALASGQEIYSPGPYNLGSDFYKTVADIAENPVVRG